LQIVFTSIYIFASTEVWNPRLFQGTGTSNATKDIDGCYGMDSIWTGQNWVNFYTIY